jgi:hypothetical protein
MRKKTLIIGIGAVFLLVLVLGTAAYAVSPSGGLSIPWWTADSGTCSSSGGSFRLSGTVGQPDAGTASGGSYNLHGGFMGTGGETPCTLRTYLAITTR